MEHLNKQQLILLALLVSFVTSIATGIVTVALMNQAPSGVIQTINRVVERTVEKVVPGPSAPSTQTIVKETVVVNEADRVVDAVAKNSSSIIRIFRSNTDPSASMNPMLFVGLGALVSDDGIVATDNGVIAEGGKYFTNLTDGKLRALTILRAKQGEQIALLQIESDPKSPDTFSKVNIAPDNSIKLGQSVVYIGGEVKNLVATGIISSISAADSKPLDIVATSTATSTASVLSDSPDIVALETSVPSEKLLAGGLIINLSGELVGMKATFMDSANTSLFVPSDVVNKTLSAFLDSQKKVQ
jgi:S1-C subfamily serine protease